MKVLSVVVVISALELFVGVNGAHWWCERKDIGLIEHGTFTYISTKMNLRQYQCENGYVSNIPDLSKIKFKCNIGLRKWEAIDVKIASTKEKFGPSNITCHKKVKCDDPPSKQDLSVSEAHKYQLKIKSYKFHLSIKEPRYFSGDIIKYSCADGHETIDTTISTYDYYNYYDSTYSSDYESNITSSQNASVSEIICDNSGLWNGVSTDKLALIDCSAIMCDASEYMNISNGNITNYKDTFGYLESMHLTCDDGYRSKGGKDSLLCFSSTSFTAVEFGCEQIMCVPPVNPVNGRVQFDGNSVGDKAYFHCDSDTTLIGEKEWTCQADGSWDSNCVICDDPQSYCSPPCIPLGAEMISADTTFYLSSTAEFTCSGRYDNMVQSVTRTCMSNRAWSGKSIDCLGKSRNDPLVGQSILSAMERTFINNTGLNETTVYGVQARSINVGSASGVDVYFLIDVSSSIDEKKMDLRKQFMKALLPKLGISDDSSGTRLAFYFFASKTKMGMNDHYAEQDKLLKNYKEAQEYIDSVNLTITRETTKLGTAITTALEDVALDIMTKPLIPGNLRRAQQVLIVISDGQYNTNGDPTEVAKQLQQKPYEAEIYSIMISNGDKNDAKAFQAMKNIASNEEDEQHFFEIHKEDLSNIIDSMIGKGNGFDGKCGVTQSHRTKLANGTVPVYEEEAMKHAWPWMAQLRGDQASHLCGGSLIDKQWILTAAHCIDATTKVYLKRLKKNEENGVEVFHIEEKHKIKHHKYNESRKEGLKYLYDVGLIKLKFEVEFSRLLLPVCLPNNATEDLFKAGKFGVVTGWGHSQARGQYSETLKQMQMSIKDCSKKSPTNFDPKRMFCAGDEDEGRIIDSCQGDSGGPFSVRKKTDEDSFVQIGIVSHGKGCKTNDKNGIYTKLTSEIVDWIHEKINVTAST